MAKYQSPYLKNALIDNAVALVTSSHGERHNVMTAIFFAESSHLPVLLRVAIAPSTLTHDFISATGWFALSVLGHGQERLALDCGTASGRDVAKMERGGMPWEAGQHGVPLLRNCLTTSECRVFERIDLPEHTLFVGEIARSFRQSVHAYRRALLLSDLVNYLGD